MFNLLIFSILLNSIPFNLLSDELDLDTESLQFEENVEKLMLEIFMLIEKLPNKSDEIIKNICEIVSNEDDEKVCIVFFLIFTGLPHTQGVQGNSGNFEFFLKTSGKL